ncbi:MAG: hypothetical protein HY395_02690 [Candidatus Doudnabacteria bacterium]|nr:hypothetical protein [Candidatus Doudnabacteria bacterium]
MHYYIVDPQNLNQRQFARVQTQLYSCLSEYRINGETSRVTSLRTVPQLTDHAISHGAKTLVAVGADDTLIDLINALKGREAVIGYIPLFETEVGSILGITDVDSGCKIIALRRIAMLDLGIVNQTAFLTKLSFGVNLPKPRTFNLGMLRQLFSLPTFEVKFSTSDYSAVLQVVGGQIINGRGPICKKLLASPMDGILDVLLLPKLAPWTMVKFRKYIMNGCFDQIPGSSLVHLNRLEISSPEGLPLRIGNHIVAKTPATVEVMPKALKMIVGKDRIF